MSRDGVDGVGPDEVPGFCLVVVGPDGVRARSGVGTADLASDLPMTSGLAMPWFSMTKIVTATTALRLAEHGTIDLDAPIAPLVPEVGDLRPAGWASRITPRHLLQHAGGFPNPIPVPWVHPADKPGPEPDAFLGDLLRKHGTLRFEPGTDSRYSNLGPLVLGAALARAAGRPFEQVVREEIFEPLGMSSSGFVFPGTPPAATGYHPRWSPMRFVLPRWVRGPSIGRWMSLRPFLLDGAAYGGVVGTPDDAARFLQLHLRDGELGGRRLISADSAAAMRRIDRPGHGVDLGLGWYVPSDRREDDPPFVQHLGGGAGFFHLMRMYPSLGRGVVVMGNATRYDVDAVARLDPDPRDTMPS